MPNRLKNPVVVLQKSDFFVQKSVYTDPNNHALWVRNLLKDTRAVNADRMTNYFVRWNGSCIGYMIFYLGNRYCGGIGFLSCC